jgi:hypothetical protein
MAVSPTVAELVGRITLNGNGDTGQVSIGSTTPFKHLCITTKPQQDPSSYTVTVYTDAIQLTQNAHVGAKAIDVINYTDRIFPANQATDSIPELAGQEFTGLPIVVEIQNDQAGFAVFDVYATFEQADHCRFGVVAQE